MKVHLVTFVTLKLLKIATIIANDWYSCYEKCQLLPQPLTQILITGLLDKTDKSGIFDKTNKSEID